MAERYPNPKDPKDNAVYSYDFSGLLGEIEITQAPAVTITNETEVDPDLTVMGTPFMSGGKAAARLSGGTAGLTYRIEFEVESEAGDRFNRSVMLKVKDL